MSSAYIVQMKAIEKSFNTNKVLHGVDFSLKEGSIHALLGENGTGKTTLMNILGGVLSANTGEIFIDGQKMVMAKPSDATEKGIAFIHQELTLVNDLNVFENLFLGAELKHGMKLDKKEMVKKSREILKKMEVPLDPHTMVRSLNASYKQIVEIARALLKNARVIIMDEPTASLTDVEIEHIFTLMRGLKQKGVSFVFISHKLNEVVEICDEYTVMRDGCVVASGEITEEITENELAKHMVGKELSYDDLYKSHDFGDVLLETKGLTREKEFTDINLTVRKGEIVGVTGLLGDGRSELFATIYGCNTEYKGEIFIEGKKVTMHSTPKAKKLGISYVPRNRKENGIIKDLSVSENMSLSILNYLKKTGLISKNKQLDSNQNYVKNLNIKVSDLNELITSLSGGNQQKVVLAKALGSEPKLVILDNPTQGVDIGAKLEIYSIIMKLALQGVSFVVLSSEAQEILRLCDQVYVMYHGKIKNTFNRDEATEEKIMVVATGGTIDSERADLA
jgi:ribose transport system ATP-binding protein